MPTQEKGIADEAKRLGMEVSDKEYERKRDDKDEERQRILQRIEDVLNMGHLMAMNFFDALYTVYDLARNDEHEAMVNNWPDWIGEIRDEVCKGGD